jgi:pentatricopeptide repeat protein
MVRACAESDLLRSALAYYRDMKSNSYTVYLLMIPGDMYVACICQRCTHMHTPSLYVCVTDF